MAASLLNANRAWQFGSRFANRPVAVGTAVARCPPHRPVARLSLLTHTVPTSREISSPIHFPDCTGSLSFRIAPVFSGTVSNASGPCLGISLGRAAFPPPAPPTVPCPLVRRISPVLCGRSATPRRAVHEVLSLIAFSHLRPRLIARGRQRGLPVLARRPEGAPFLCMPGAFDSAGPAPHSRVGVDDALLPSWQPDANRLPAPLDFGLQYPAYRYPCPTLPSAALPAALPHGFQGQGGSLFLPCTTLSFATPCRFIPALSRFCQPAPHSIYMAGPLGRTMRYADLRIPLRRLRDQIRKVDSPQFRSGGVPILRAEASGARAFHLRRARGRWFQIRRDAGLPQRPLQ